MPKERYKIFVDMQNKENIVDIIKGEPLTLDETCDKLNKLTEENKGLKKFFEELKGSGYWKDDYLTVQDWDDVKLWINRMLEKVLLK